MQYLIYFAVVTPLLLGWLFWETAGESPPPPMFHSFADTLEENAQADRARRQLAAQANRNVSVDRNLRGSNMLDKDRTANAAYRAASKREASAQNGHLVR